MPSVAVDQITFRELLQDPIFKKYVTTVPDLATCQQHNPRPWYVYVQREEFGPWSRGKVSTYPRAFNHLKKFLSDGAHDIAIVSRARGYWPPLINRCRGYEAKDGTQIPCGKPRRPHRLQKIKSHKFDPQWWHNYPQSHHWCPFCRRPTVFRERITHHTLSSVESFYLNGEPLCEICGCRSTDPYVGKFHRKIEV